MSEAFGKNRVLTLAMVVLSLISFPALSWCHLGSERLNHDIDSAPRTDRELEEHKRKLAVDPGDCDTVLQLALDYLNLADAKHWEYLEHARDHLKRLHSTHPNDPLIRMYLGRAIGAMALNPAPGTLERLRWAREGFRHMDRAVALDDENPFLRLLRAESQLLAHPILRRNKTLREDAAIIIRFAETAAFEKLPAYQRGRVHLFIGSYLARNKRERASGHEHWDRAARLAAGTAVADEATARMAGRFRSLGYEGD